MSMAPETTEKLNDLRTRIATGVEYTKEELTDAIKLLRSERMTGVSTSKAPAGKKAKPSTLPTNLEDLFG